MDDIRRPQPPKQAQPTLPQVAHQVPAPQKPRTSPDQHKDYALPKKRSKKRMVLAGITAIFALVVALIGLGLWWYNDALLPRSNVDSHVRVTIAPGATVQQVGDLLQQKGVIKSGLAFQLYARQHNRTSLKAGDYVFSPAQLPTEIVTWLHEGKTDTFNLTILPGTTLKGIKEALAKDGFEAAEIDAAYARTYDHPLLASKPAGVSLEGYIFPETYNLTSSTTVEQLLIRTFDEFYERIQASGIEQALQTRGFTLHEGITLASLVQKEVSNEDDRRQVAQVFERRLEIDMPLGSDVTFLYAAELLGVEPSVSIDSPYNTRRYGGLPPGAIANFNFSALDAVAHPATGDYLYFVSGDDGVTHFSHTIEEHEQNVARYCTKLCQ